MSVESDMIRKTFKESDDRRDAGLSTPVDIVRIDDIQYGKDSKWQRLDVYYPKSAGREKLPVIVSVHGGAWVYGDKETYQYYCMNLAQRGFSVVNFTYRLAPEYKFPASVEDTNAVFTWVLNNAAKYGFDIRNIFAVGDSAGAHLLSIYTAICTNSEYAKEFDIKIPSDFAPAAIALNCGVYKVDLKTEDGDNRDILLMEDYLPGKGTYRELQIIDSGEYITEQYPPVFIMTSEGDFLKNQAQIFVEKLMSRNVPFVYRYYKNPEYELGHVFHCNIRLPDAALCNDEECDFFKRICR